MKQRILVAFAVLALAYAVNFGLASAHPFADPTPPPAGVDHEGGHQDGQMDEPQAGDMNETDMNESGTDGESEDDSGTAGATGQDQQGEQGQQDRNTEQDGEFEGDN